MRGQKHRSLLEELEKEETRLAEIDADQRRAQDRIAELRAEIAALTKPHESAAATDASPPQPNRATPHTSRDKVALFRRLFRGRVDVFPKRWVNARKRTQGYSPACGNEWVPGVCEKPRVRCGECPNQAFFPVTDQMILDHIRGGHVAGVYPMLPDDTCYFLAIDFDKGEWRTDVAAVVDTCRHMGLPAAVERSRSGEGAHVWFFFMEPVLASAARQLGCHLITRTMAGRHDLPMSSYDRLFPNQDTLPRGGFGNLIALPFQDGPRQQGNTVFVDDDWEPHRNQWGFLATIQRLHAAHVEELARDASQTGQVIGIRMADSVDDDMPEPWTRLPLRAQAKHVIRDLPKQVDAVLAQLLFIEKNTLPAALLNQIKRLAAFQNPEFYKKQALRLSTSLTPRIISCAEDLPRHIGLPRGCLADVEALLAQHGVRLSVEDKRCEGTSLELDFHGELSRQQDDAVRTLLAHDCGVFVAPPGSGKTVVGAYLIAERRRNTLVLVHRTQLLEQWIAQLALFLGVKPKDIGQIGGGKRRGNGQLDVAMIQSMIRGHEVDDAVAGYGQVIVDECHHVSAVSFERVLREVKARYVVGLTATPTRRDGHHPILRLQLGPVRFAIDPKRQATQRSFEHRLIVRNTEFRLPDTGNEMRIQDLYRELSTDKKRNTLILDDVVRSLDEGRSPILLTERRDHLEYLAADLRKLTPNLIVLQGGMRSKARREAMEHLGSVPATEERLVIATGRFIGEGFDDARLDTLFLVLPVSWRGTLVQYAGRLHRQHQAKKDVRIFDYVDSHVPMLARMFTKRMRGYRAMGYSLVDGPDIYDDSEESVIEYDNEALRSLDQL